MCQLGGSVSKSRALGDVGGFWLAREHTTRGPPGANAKGPSAIWVIVILV